MSSNPTGIIFATQRMSVHDGPGWRTLVFLKGCPLRCRWCANPESWSIKPELAYNESRCLGTLECDACITTCQAAAFMESEKGQSVTLERPECTDCGDCVEVCPADALYMFGREVSVEEVVRLVEEDSVFHSRSQGGLTLGGGEPLLQPDFAAALLEQCRANGIHTGIETCGAASWSAMEKVCRHADTILYDIKSTNEQKHKQYTGAGNRKILRNLEQLAKHFPETPVTVRTPVIPGFNDTLEEIEKIMQVIGNLSCVDTYELLPYHRFGTQKYRYLGKQYTLETLTPPPPEKIRELYSVVPAYFRSSSI